MGKKDLQFQAKQEAHSGLESLTSLYNVHKSYKLMQDPRPCGFRQEDFFTFSLY